MKWILLTALAAAPAAAAERRYTVTDFDRVVVEGPFPVTLATGRASSAIATGSAAALDRLSIDVQGRTLRIRPYRSAWGGYPGEDDGPVRIALGTHDLSAVSVTGSGTLDVDKAKGLRFEVGVSGNGRIAIASLDADRLTVGLAGGGSIEIAGKAKALKATVNGSGNLAAGKLVAEDAELNADTAGLIDLAVSRSAKVTASGAGDVTILGTPACIVKASGAGRVSCGRN